MSPSALSRQQLRRVDQLAVEQYRMHSLVLMENAGRGSADCLQQLGIPGRVVICCGKGNNAGDGFVVARHLELRGFEVLVCLWSDPAELPGDAAANLRILQRAQTPLRLCHHRSLGAWWPPLQTGDWVVDALLGTGARGAPRTPLDEVIRGLNALEPGIQRAALDLPSGLDCDTGQPHEPTFRADHTFSFVAAKIGFSRAEAAPWLGRLHILDIGVPRALMQQAALGFDPPSD